MGILFNISFYVTKTKLFIFYSKDSLKILRTLVIKYHVNIWLISYVKSVLLSFLFIFEKKKRLKTFT